MLKPDEIAHIYEVAKMGNDVLQWARDNAGITQKEDTPNTGTVTGGKWKVEYCLDQSIFINEGDNPIAMIQSEEDNGITPEMEENANRIVQAVNGWDKLQEQLTFAMDSWHKENEMVAKLEADNERLREALQGLYDTIDRCLLSYHFGAEIGKAKAALQNN